jgi:AcrR family transcriptional regulator
MGGMARPRSFDRDAALEQAMLAFWENGYEKTCISELTKAMGIAAPSLYAAFGDKRSLFDEAVALYAERGAFVAEGLAEPTARAGVERMLRTAAAAYPGGEHPAGCLMVTEPLLADHRAASRAAIVERLRRGVDEGDLPASTDVDALAGFVGVVIGGMSARARDGATAEELLAVAETAMAAWPA